MKYKSIIIEFLIVNYVELNLVLRRNNNES